MCVTFQAANVQQTLTSVKASNQQSQFLGNKVEMAITKAIENNKSLLKVGLHFQFGDCRLVFKLFLIRFKHCPIFFIES